jgi:ferritin-like protein
MMDKPTDTGMNRTGIATSPIDSKKTIEAAAAMPTTGALDGKVLEGERVVWARDAEPIGTVPPPGSLKGMAKTALEILEGHKPTVLIDKLGERLAYERTGTRLYEALLAKYEAANVHEGGPTRAELEQIRNEEHEHVLLVRDAMRELGADPTAMTPSADLVGVAGSGWIQVLTDPRTTLSQCLEVMLIAEDGDGEGWSLLVQLTGELGFDELAGKFRQANLVEEEHARKVRLWLTNSVLGQAGAEPTPPREIEP